MLCEELSSRSIINVIRHRSKQDNQLSSKGKFTFVDTSISTPLAMSNETISRLPVSVATIRGGNLRCMFNPHIFKRNDEDLVISGICRYYHVGLINAGPRFD